MALNVSPTTLDFGPRPIEGDWFNVGYKPVTITNSGPDTEQLGEVRAEPQIEGSMAPFFPAGQGSWTETGGTLAPEDVPNVVELRRRSLL